MDLGKVGLLNCDRSGDRGRAVKMTMVNKACSLRQGAANVQVCQTESPCYNVNQGQV